MSVDIRSETKDKFDALLKLTSYKKARKSGKSGSTQNLLEGQQSTCISISGTLNKSNEGEENIAMDELHYSSSNYILNKFLGHQTTNSCQMDEELASVEVQNENLSNIRPPIPKPRKSKCKNQSPTTSQRTFEITSPKILNNNDNSSLSNKTYNVEEIGDVLLHESPLHSKVAIKIDKGSEKDLETLSNNNDSTTTEKDKTSSNSLKNEPIMPVMAESGNLSSVSTEDKQHETTSKSRKKTKKRKSNDTLDLKKKQYTYEKIVELIIHKTDQLQLNSLVVHPVVKIHVVDISTGKYFPKSDKNRSVVFFYENKDYDYISPVMTHTYNLQEKRILFPSWEETVLLNEDYEYFKDEMNHIILFFEILDFVSFSAIHQLNQKDCAKGWHHIAFAFLKLSSKNGDLNLGKRMRLQLYYSRETKKEDPHMCSPWTWWKKKTLEKYPSTLYVTIKSTLSPTKIVETFRSKTPIQRETSSKMKLFEDLKREVPDLETTFSDSKKNDNEFRATSPTWSRSTHETCKLPNKCLVKFNSYEDGCFIMKFSTNGLLLACAVRNEKLFYIIVFSISSLKELNKFPCHQGLIYDIKWSHDDSLLITASADNTISIFNVTTYSFVQILPHPSFVYCCDICDEKFIVSGCYDGIVRIWNRQEQSKKKIEFHLFQELEGHKGYITSICFSKKSNILSADSCGVIIEWKKETDDWILKREITILDLKETIINQILLFPKKKKLLVHSRDSTIRIIDLKSGCVLQWLRGALNKRLQTFCTISPCGTFVYSGSENGYVHVWNSKNGFEIASYVPYPGDNNFLIIHCAEYHPFDNIIALSHYGKNLPILLYSYDKTLLQPEIDVIVKNSEECSQINKQGRLEAPKLRSIVKKQYCDTEKIEKNNFKDILQKMDNIITSQNHM